MLSRTAKKVLKLAQSSKDRISCQDLKSALNIDFEAAKSACDQLIENGYASEKRYQPMPGQSIFEGIVLTEKGRNSKKYFWANVASFLFKSIFVPVFVAFITAVMTTLAMQWFQG